MSITCKVLKTAMKGADGKYITFDTLAANYEKVTTPGEPFVRSDSDDTETLLEDNEGD